MRKMAVLALSPSEDGILSAQIVFWQRGTELRCGGTMAEAAGFLARHPGALVLCRWAGQDRGRNAALSWLLGAGRPSAVVWMGECGRDKISVEVRPAGDLRAAREILGNPELLRKIYLAWSHCGGSLPAPHQVAGEALKELVM